MEIVIKISEERFRDIQRIAEVQLECNHFKTAEQIIAKGTPLPKGHGDLIDRGKTVERICKVAEFMDEKRKNLGSPYIMAALFIQDNKEEFPTIIEADKESEDK